MSARNPSHKRITDAQIAAAVDNAALRPGTSPMSNLMAATGYPPDKCLLALQHAERRGLIERTALGFVVNPMRIRDAGHLPVTTPR